MKPTVVDGPGQPRGFGRRLTPSTRLSLGDHAQVELAAELVLARAEIQRYRALFENLPDAAFSLDAAGHVTDANLACARLRGIDGPALVGVPLAEVVAPEDAALTVQHVAATLRGSTQTWNADVVHTSGRRSCTEITAIPMRSGGAVVGVYGVARDVTIHRVMEERLVHQAFHDPLTGLANRVLFRDRVERAMTRATGDAEFVAVLFVDLDDFKTVNDSLGHAEGDRVLEVAATRLLKATRGYDLVARLGGDEFGVLLEGLKSPEDTADVVARVQQSLSAPLTLGEREVALGASLGVAHGRDATTADELLRNADVAMYRAKAAGKGVHAEFDPSMHVAALERLELAADLRHAVERDELRLLYQPVVALESGTVIGAEALLRWQHPRRGLVSPLTFIPLAEETGTILDIGLWVLRTACAQLACWHDTVPSGRTITVGVNVSGRQLEEPAFVDLVAETLRSTGARAEQLVLEITESVIMRRADETLATLHALKGLGVKLAIDDFGTGYSSLSYIQRFPVDVLKIDRSFVDGVARGGSESALARAMVALGGVLGLRTVAEGIEHAEQRDALRAIGCQLGQGFLFARPVGVGEFEALLGRTVDGRSEK
jgi:diguanylate cyclase (GGDEF)-like protein/PAS domain S-box-containing protein